MFLAFLQANKSRIPVTWDYSGVQYLFKLVLSSNLNLYLLLSLQCMGKAKLTAGFARQKHDHELRFKLVPRTWRDERPRFQCVAFRHDSVDDWGRTGTPKE